MPQYSFQERFVPWVLDGTKTQTIRGLRKNRAKPGDTLYLFSGLRTKHCKRLATVKCTEVKTVVLIYDNIFLLPELLSDERIRRFQSYSALQLDRALYSRWIECRLSTEERDRFAYADGFREGELLKVQGCFDIMYRWWRATHQLPFIGDVIYWTGSG